MRRKTINNKGVALVTVVLFFLVLVILLGGVMFSSISNQGNAKLSKDHTSAYYVAESGLNISMETLKKHLITEGYNNITSGYTTKMELLDDYIRSLNSYSTTGLNGQTGNLTGTNPNGTFTITATRLSDDLYEIKSKGSVNGVDRFVVTTFDIDPILVEKGKAILTKGTIDVKFSTIRGPIASLFDPIDSEIRLSCNGNTETVISDVFIPEKDEITSSQYIIGGCDAPSFSQALPVPDDVDFEDIELPPYYVSSELKKVTKDLTNKTYTLSPLLGGEKGYYIDDMPSGDSYFKLNGVSEDDEFNLFVGNVNTSTFENTGNIFVDGKGKLLMHVAIDPVFKNGKEVEAIFEWKLNINPDKYLKEFPLDKFQLIIKSAKNSTTDLDFTKEPTLVLKNPLTFVGSLIMDKIKVELGSVDYQGFIATMGSRVDLTSNTNMAGPIWIYAPFADVYSQTPNKIYGSIISKTFTMTAGGTLEYLGYSGSVPELIKIPEFLGGAPVPAGITFSFINFKEV